MASIRVIRLGNFPPINYGKNMKCNQKVDDGKMIFVWMEYGSNISFNS